jgi:hypothetical protein
MPLEEPTDYASFLLRLWRRREPGLPEDASGWQGEVEHIQTGGRWTFDTLHELLSILRRQADGPSKVEEQG